MSAQQLLEILLHAANTGIDLSQLKVGYPDLHGEYSISLVDEVKIDSDYLMLR